MHQQPRRIERRQVAEWSFYSQNHYENPFTDIAVDVLFTGPQGQAKRLPAFYDGENRWVARFNPHAAGDWHFQVFSTPEDPGLHQSGLFTVLEAESRGFLQATPGKAWGFHYESGEPVFLLGDTVYNLFGMAFCGGDVASFLQRRAGQGFNLLRVRLPVSPFHPPEGYSAWQTRRTWPWGGSEQAPRFDCFNLDYFKTVDQVVQQAEALGIGLEMIMEAWGFEFPFNSRNIFVPEWEELWMRYLIARYDAYNCVYFWTPMNEYEFYPNGDWHHKPVADRWAMRIARWIKAVGQHGHIVSVHNGPGVPPFARRFAADPGAVDAVLFQTWGTTGKQDGWLAAGIEEQIAVSFYQWWGSAVLAEWGYERNPNFELLLPGHLYCDPEHTRRGAWRGAFSGMGIIHGFENSWGPWMILDEDQPGLAYLLHLRRFVREVIPFWRMRPEIELVQMPDVSPGFLPRALASTDKDVIAVYFPAGGEVVLNLPEDRTYQASWYDPRTGEIQQAALDSSAGLMKAAAPGGQDGQGHPYDFALILKLEKGQ